jgi:antitoxin component of MazEF toxin-antitoxin module
VGPSLDFRIPRLVAREPGLRDGQMVDSESGDGALKIRPRASPVVTLDVLLVGVTDENLHSEAEWGAPEGREVNGYPFEILLPEDALICGAVLADHVRSVDWRQRRAESVGKASPDLLEAVTKRIETLIRPEARER